LSKPVKFADRDSNSQNESDLDSKQQIFCGIEDPVKSFTGRKDKLRELKGLIQYLMLPAVTISGLAGMGKSELVKKYIKLNKSTIAICHWVNGDSAET